MKADRILLENLKIIFLNNLLYMDKQDLQCYPNYKTDITHREIMLT